MASTSRQSPSAGSPSRPSAIEKPRSVSVSRQSSARLMAKAISSGDRSRWRRMRTVRPARRARVTACRTGFMSGPGQLEPVRVQDRLVAEFERVETGLAEGLCGSGTRAHHAGRPAVGLAQRQPRADGGRPGSRVADRVAAGQADADLDAVGDGGPPVRREHHRLVAAGGEVAQRVVLAPDLEHSADGRFVLTGQRVLGPLGLEQHDRGDHERQRAEQSEQRVDEHVRVSGEGVGVRAGEGAHPVQRIAEAGPTWPVSRGTARAGPSRRGCRSPSPQRASRRP